MTTPNEIDRRLALACGYTADRVRNGSHGDGWVQVLNDDSRGDGPMQYGGWQRFDHTDPAVIWPIAERFDAFPTQRFNGTWFAMPCDLYQYHAINECAASASALAVIKYVEGK